jgi:hypothetical protein
MKDLDLYTNPPILVRIPQLKKFFAETVSANLIKIIDGRARPETSI